MIPGLLAPNARPSSGSSLVAPPTTPATPTSAGTSAGGGGVPNPVAPPDLIASDPTYSNPTSAEQATLADINAHENGGGNPMLVHYAQNGGDATSLDDVQSRTVAKNSHAFGDYGFQPDTYRMAANGVGFDPSDISKANQDRAALYLLRNYGPNASISWKASGVNIGKPYNNPFQKEFLSPRAREEQITPRSLLQENGAVIGAELLAPEPLSRRAQVTPESAAACLSLTAEEIYGPIGNQPQVFSVGLPFLAVELASRGALRRAASNRAAYSEVLPLDGARSVYAASERFSELLGFPISGPSLLAAFVLN
jgi:hypothetical protein